MSGHSKWHNIQKRKGAVDARRAGMFTKLAKGITVATREGGNDPSFNFQLRIAIDAAKAANMPKENIERSIKRGTGEGAEGQIEEIIYEGFGPGGVAFLVQCLSDNRNRTVAEVKYLVGKHGGTIGNPGSVMWMFERKGVVTFLEPKQIKDREAFELAMIEAGAQDIQESEGTLQVVSEVGDLQAVVGALESLSLKPDGAGIEYFPKDRVPVSTKEEQEQLETLLDALDENEDVDTVYTNAE
ncbi:MAG: hypothetical protein UU08_C0006G0002 [Candidatus Uhrbacteria bacterium GW2011_GWE2_40_58]|nr:MAG: hypothetical protein UT94_C0007G0047 [Candidatus Uhrbacteria bacterium GW2011_GWF2_40_263]KKR67884.1 MAG: hypothetical protein UU08_C0006G0002 [Candidatus Uhrbacteria bacterium GW2011_GWE2_40_58]OGL93753.1 MAG: hypothetical protein A2239_00915 [Candidatus Uhrbacteria bacterium RIFOXYA2_FULL_40_9]OGL96853.1 MAG: hypothetical protein A2332_01885 [Candidatus Uhrbacteria bacterium RIFOXYB2_FULL_41_18]HBK34551.1 YebC/PmpR family DNA-binding transcriptional regulator [Candidatus Uhrbacteria b